VQAKQNTLVDAADRLHALNISKYRAKALALAVTAQVGDN
jgi:hypothetical protein